MYLFLFTHDCEVFCLKTLVESCTVYYQTSCRLLLNVVFMKLSDMQYIVMLNINVRSRTDVKIRLHISEISFRIWKVCF